jgi:hypothetical protein
MPTVSWPAARALRAYLFLFALCAGLLPACTLAAECDVSNAKCADVAMHSPVRSMAYWSYDPTSSLQSRVLSPPPELLTYLYADNVLHNYAGHPAAVEITPDIRRDFNQAIREMPAAVKRVVSQRLIGVFLVRDLGSTGFTDISAASGKYPNSGYVVIDVSVFNKRNANAWATWKERSPFTQDGNDSLTVRIEDKKNDNRAHAIQYILLHEFGHVASIDRNVHPPWNVAPPEDHTLQQYPFANLSWRVAPNGDHYVSVFDDAFPDRTQISFYRNPKLSSTQIVSTYQSLLATNFATLYGATSPGDDFAESFANYVHVVMMGRPFSISMTRNSKEVATYRSCWGEERCAGKRKIIEKLFAVGPR